MKKKYIVGLIFLISITFSLILMINKINKSYNTHRMSSPQMEARLSENASFLTKLKYYIDGYPKVDYINSISNNISEFVLEKEYKNANKECKNIVGWIEIPGTDINYPINYNGYGKDDNYYLHHNWNNKKYWNGAVFLDSENNGFQNWTLLNGHNMLNGIMFSELTKYENIDFIEKHPYINIYEGANINKLKKFRIVGVTYAPDTVNFNLGNLTSDQMKKQYNTLLSKPIYKLSDYNEKDIMMLNTCLSNGTDNHLLILAEDISDNNNLNQSDDTNLENKKQEFNLVISNIYKELKDRGYLFVNITPQELSAFEGQPNAIMTPEQINEKLLDGFKGKLLSSGNLESNDYIVDAKMNGQNVKVINMIDPYLLHTYSGNAFVCVVKDNKLVPLKEVRDSVNSGSFEVKESYPFKFFFTKDGINTLWNNNGKFLYGTFIG